MAHVWFTPLAPKESKEATARNKSSPKAPRTPRPEKPAKVAKAKAAKAKVQPVPSKITKKAAPRQLRMCWNVSINIGGKDISTTGDTGTFEDV